MRTIRENAGRLILFSAMVIGFTACSNVKIEGVSDQRKVTAQDTVSGFKIPQIPPATTSVTYVQNPVETASVERVGEEESNSGAAMTPESGTTETAKKKRMSNTVKGALIGAGAGAITGAVVSKKRGKGAVIGGAIGAAVGAGVGAVIDKKKKDAAEPK